MPRHFGPVPPWTVGTIPSDVPLAWGQCRRPLRVVRFGVSDLEPLRRTDVPAGQSSPPKPLFLYVETVKVS